MEENKVRAWYEKSVDILYMLFKEGPSYEVIEADPDIHLELDEKGKIMGIEIWNAEKSGLIKQVAKAIAKQPLERQQSQPPHASHHKPQQPSSHSYSRLISSRLCSSSPLKTE